MPMPLPAGAPLGQGGSLQGPSNQDGGAQVAEGGEQGVNVPNSEEEGAGKANPEAPKSADGEANPDSGDDDLRVVHQMYMDNPTNDLRLKDDQHRARIRAEVEKKKQLMKKKSTKKTRGVQEARRRAGVGGNFETPMEFPMNQLRAPFTIPRNSETMELDEEPEMLTGSQQERDAMTPEGASEEAQQETGVQMEVESNNHDTGAPQGGARTDGNRGNNSAKITECTQNQLVSLPLITHKLCRKHFKSLFRSKNKKW